MFKNLNKVKEKIKNIQEDESINVSTVRINPEDSKLVTPLSNQEYEMLKSSIKQDGLHYPIVVNPKGEILDGYHRYRICKELKIPIKSKIKYFVDPIEEKRFVIDINLKRRQLNKFQKIECAYELEKIEKERARQRQLSKLKDVKEKLEPLAENYVNGSENESGKVSNIIAKKIGLSPRTYEMAKVIIENGSEKVKQNLREGKSKISKEYKIIQKDMKRKNYLANNVAKSAIENSENISLLHGEFSKLTQKLNRSSVDLIFTDPPYSKEFLYLYERLADLADYVLKDGGSLVFYTGHIILAEVFNIFRQKNLTYWWTFAVKHSGHHTKIHQRNVFAEWKPLLWFVKGAKPNDLVISNTFGDYIESIATEKINHKWQQSTVEAEYIIKYLTLENQTVLDPMMGSATTGIASLNLKRRFIGIEKDHGIFSIAHTRIKNFMDRKTILYK